MVKEIQPSVFILISGDNASEERDANHRTTLPLPLKEPALGLDGRLVDAPPGLFSIPDRVY